MKTLTKACALAATAVLSLAPMAGATPTASHPQPIFGTTAGPDAYASPDTCPPGAAWRFFGSGTGRMSHLGTVTVTNNHCTYLGDSSVSGGQLTMTAANGDELFMTYSGGFELVFEGGNPVRSDITLEWDIVGGNGRFDGATGSGEGIGYSIITGPTSSTTTMNYAGMISTAVGANKSK